MNYTVFVILFVNAVVGFYLFPLKHLFISVFPHEWLLTCFMIIIERKSVEKKRGSVLDGLLFY